MESLFRVMTLQQTMHHSSPGSISMPIHRSVGGWILIDTNEFIRALVWRVEQRAEAFAQIGYQQDSARPCVVRSRGVD